MVNATKRLETFDFEVLDTSMLSGIRSNELLYFRVVTPSNICSKARSPNGTFGTTVPFYSYYDGMSARTQYLGGLRNGPNFRTNLACTPVSTIHETIDETIELWDLATGTYAVKKFQGTGYFQINDLFAPFGLSSLVTDSATAFVTLESTPDHARRVFNATVNDNHTPDPVFVGRGYMVFPPPSP